MTVADWIDERLLPFGRNAEGVLVGEIVPTGFEAYARILHPVHRGSAAGEDLVRWAEVARECGKRIHPEVQLNALMGREDANLPVEIGSLPEGAIRPLTEVLRGITRSLDRCWFCVWEGYGFWFGGTILRRVPSGRWRAWLAGRRQRHEARRRSRREWEVLDAIPKVDLMREKGVPQRRYLLFSGSLDAAGSMYGAWGQSPNYWWPEDRTWIVASELDATSTYVGGSAALVEAIRARDDLEVVPSDPGHRFDWLGDELNATPEPR